MALLNVLRSTTLHNFTCNSFLRTLQCKINFEPPSDIMCQNLTQIRFHHRNERVFRKIRGGGRPVREGVVIPEPKKYGWRPVYPKDGQYTTNPLPIIKMGGRHPETGMF